MICHVTLLGGAFGRKSKPDYVAEAAILSKKVGKPVKVAWTREEDIQLRLLSFDLRDVFQSGAGCVRQALAWLQRSVFPPIRLNLR